MPPTATSYQRSLAAIASHHARPLAAGDPPKANEPRRIADDVLMLQLEHRLEVSIEHAGRVVTASPVLPAVAIGAFATSRSSF